MAALTTDSSVTDREVWVHLEGYEKKCLTLELHTEIVDDVMQMVLGNTRYKYDAFHRGQCLRSGAPIPTDASADEPIKIKHIIIRSSSPSIEDDNDAYMDIPKAAMHKSRTHTMHSNYQQAAKCGKSTNKWQKNYDPNGANTSGTSRDCLLSTGTSSNNWTFNGLLQEAASYLWHRTSNGNNTSYKQKSE